MQFRAMVLVVEDDPLNRLIAVDALDEAGFEAVDFGRADEALEYAQTEPGPIAALLTDIGVPGDQDGIELASHFASRWPEKVLIVTSGRFGSTRPEAIPDSALYLMKPWRGRELVAMLRAGLAETVGPAAAGQTQVASKAML